jgi:hypothetical protein
MKGERKLRLVTGGGEARIAETDEPPFTDEELAEAAALRDRLDRGDDELALALKAAHVPGPLAEADLDAIVARALGDEAAATAHERAAGEKLRAELAVALGPQAAPNPAPAEPAQIGEGAALLMALKLAAAPTEISAAKNDELISAAFRRALRKGGPVRRIAPVTMAALAGITALAAGIALLLGRVSTDTATAQAALVPARSAQELFDPATPFPRRGGESARIDRIATARASDLRQNRFTTWGVR